MNENLSLGRIAGIHVGLNWSLLVIAFLIASSLATNFLPSAAPGEATLRFRYGRSWESKPAQLHSIPLRVGSPESRTDP